MDDDENDGVDEDEEGRGRGLALHRMRMYDCLWLLDIWMVVGRKRCFFFFVRAFFFRFDSFRSVSSFPRKNITRESDGSRLYTYEMYLVRLRRARGSNEISFEQTRFLCAIRSRILCTTEGVCEIKQSREGCVYCVPAVASSSERCYSSAIMGHGVCLLSLMLMLLSACLPCFQVWPCVAARRAPIV